MHVQKVYMVGSSDGSSALTEFQAMWSHGNPIQVNFCKCFRTYFLYNYQCSCFFEKVHLIWPLRPIPHVEKTRKWILSLWGFHLNNGIWTVITSQSTIFWWKADFHFKALKIRYALRKVRAGLLYLQNMVIIFSEYTIFRAGAGGTLGRELGEPGRAGASTSPLRHCIRTLWVNLVREYGKVRLDEKLTRQDENRKV